jgi:hypothetical protein
MGVTSAALTGQEINLPQLGDDLFGLVALPCHRSIHPKWPSDQHKGWITLSGSDHNLHRMRTGATPRR